jgi:eukaryotic-like serine/threonine-protein kinase
LQSALTLAEKIGDRQLQTRCLTYLTTLFRLQSRAELVRSYAARNLAAAVEINLQEYISSAMANQAWLAWREGKLEQAEVLALEAMTRLTTSRIGLVFKWLAFFPLIDICLKEQRLEQAIQFAREILAPDQQLLPEAISNPLEKSIENWEANDKGNASEQLYAVIELAEQLGYL